VHLIINTHNYKHEAMSGFATNLKVEGPHILSQPEARGQKIFGILTALDWLKVHCYFESSNIHSKKNFLEKK